MTRQRPRGATIVDVASYAGVSPMTVSRVINGRDGVRDETRAVVLSAVDALGYTPNLAARSLVTATELKIGLVYSNPSAAFMSEFLTGAFEEASARGVRLILLKGSGRAPPTPEAVRKLVKSGVAGVILTPPLAESPSVLRLLEQAAVPLASVGSYNPGGAISVRIDDRLAAFQMTRRLIELGHRKLGMIVGNPDQAASAERLAGFHAALCDEDVEISVAHGDFSYSSGLDAGEQLLGRDQPPTAIFASNDDMAAAVISVAHRRHLDVPGELTVVGFDDTTTAVTLWPPLTTVHQPVRDLAAEAIGLLISGIIAPNGFADGPRLRVFPHHIVERQSTAPFSTRQIIGQVTKRQSTSKIRQP